MNENYLKTICSAMDVAAGISKKFEGPKKAVEDHSAGLGRDQQNLKGKSLAHRGAEIKPIHDDDSKDR